MKLMPDSDDSYRYHRECTRRAANSCSKANYLSLLSCSFAFLSPCHLSGELVVGIFARRIKGSHCRLLRV